MPLDAQLRRRVRQALRPPGPSFASDAPRLDADARRLWRRVRRFARDGLVRTPPDDAALELACWALQLPMRRGEDVAVGRLGIGNLRDRAELAAQRLVEELADDADADLLDRTARLLHETPGRPPVLEEAKLLADAVNLDDFGAGGALRQLAELAVRGEGVDTLLDAWHKGRDYGYWQARLADGFHFPAVRRLARRRLDNARRLFDLLDEERAEDAE